MKAKPNGVVRRAAGAVEQALLASYNIYEQLGNAGTEPVRKNRFGDVALRGDVEAEEAVLSVMQGAGLRATILSEEHGTQIINGTSKLPKVTGVLDGIDGSSVYVKDRERGKYGTMFALFAGEHPSYSDYLAAGIMQHASATLLLAIRGQGLAATDLHTGKQTQLQTKSGKSLHSEGTVAYVDNMPLDKSHPLYEYFAFNDRTFARPLRRAGIEPIWIGASAAYYAAVAMGEADIVGESTRKNNLEIATAYGIIAEAGGVMITIDGHDIGPQQLLEFGQQTHVAVLTAANQSIANAVIRLLHV